MRTFNTILRQNNLRPVDVRLLRHADSKAPMGTPYEFWRDHRDSKFVLYQEHQETHYRKILNADYWAAFVVPPDNKTLFAGLYRVEYVGALNEQQHQQCSVHHRRWSCDEYKLILDDKLKNYIGKLSIDWGRGYKTWIQYAHKQDKMVIEAES